MTKPLVRNPNWSLRQQDNMIIVSGGADETYAVTAANESVAREFMRRAEQNNIDLEHASREVMDLVAELQRSNILYEKKPEIEPLRVHILWLGEKYPQITQCIDEDSKHANFTLVIRTTKPMQEILDSSRKLLDNPHLYVDASMHHTVAVGPLVFPNETSCLFCFLGRVNKHWGDVAPASKPLVLEEDKLIAGLIERELKAIANQDYSLINTTVAYDWQQRRTVKSTIYKLPWCKWCSDKPRDGKVALPWIDDSPRKPVR